MQLRQTRQLLGPQVGDARYTANQLRRLPGEPRQFVEIGAEDPHREIGRRPTQAFVDSHAERRREQDRDARHALEALAHIRLDRLEVARAVRLEHDKHIRDRVRHRILGTFGASGPPDDVLDFAYLAQLVLDAMVQAIDFVKRRLCW